MRPGLRTLRTGSSSAGPCRSHLGTRAYDGLVDAPRRGLFGWLPPALRTLERKLGADREGRTLWVWVVPASTLVVTFVILAFIGVEGKVDLGLTLPMAFVLSLFLGSLSAFYLTAASSDERDKDDGPDDRRGPRMPPEKPPPPDTRSHPGGRARAHASATRGRAADARGGRVRVAALSCQAGAAMRSRQVAHRHRVAVLDGHVAGVEELELHVGDADLGQRVAECDRAEVEEELVAGAGVDVDPRQRSQRVRVAAAPCAPGPRRASAPTPRGSSGRSTCRRAAGRCRHRRRSTRRPSPTCWTASRPPCGSAAGGRAGPRRTAAYEPS